MNTAGFAGFAGFDLNTYAGKNGKGTDTCLLHGEVVELNPANPANPALPEEGVL